MRLEQVILHHVRMPLVSPFQTSFGTMRERECLIVEARAGGLIGWGECVASDEPTYSYETVETAWHITRDFLVPAIQSVDLPDARAYLAAVGHIRGHRMAKAGIEMALWDLWGQQSSQSLAAMLGGERPAVPVGVSVGIQASPQDLLRVVSDYRDQGYQRVKIKIKPGRDVGDVLIVRQAFAELALQVDANSAYTLETAEALYPLDDLELLLIEQPLGDEDLWDHHKLQQQLRTPICLDESILGMDHARHAVEMDAARVINIKQGRVGGLQTSRDIHDYCVRHEIPVWCGGMLETGIGRAANLALASLLGFSLPGDISATERYYRQDIIAQRFVLNADSTIDVPIGPGLGIEVDRKALKAHTLRTENIQL